MRLEGSVLKFPLKNALMSKKKGIYQYFFYNSHL